MTPEGWLRLTEVDKFDQLEMHQGILKEATGVRWIRDIDMDMNMTAGEVLQCEDLARREKRQRRAGVSGMVLPRSSEQHHSELEPRTQGEPRATFPKISHLKATIGSTC